MDVCGIDPGLGTTGYAVVNVRDASPLIVRDAGIIRTDASADLAARLHQLETDVLELFQHLAPDGIGVEQLYSHYAHPRTAIMMGHARGVILAAAARCNIPVRSFGATRIKRYLTGNGRASKRQIQNAITATLKLATPPEPDDVADALAVALCCADAMRKHDLEITAP